MQGQQREFDYGLSPVIDKLNQEIIRNSGQSAFYGRKEVVLGFRDAKKLPLRKVLEIIDQNWHLIEQPGNPHR